MIARAAARCPVTVPTPPAPDGLRIGVMGGSFNPPHVGHLTVARTAIRRCGLDRLWWLVTPGNPLKCHDALQPLATRLDAVKALAADGRMVVTAFEAGLQSSYTAETLAFLKARHARTRFVWVMGADNLATFHRWQNWKEIARMMPLAVVDRPGWRFAALASPAARTLARSRLPEDRAALLPFAEPPAWTFLTTRLSPLSSTELRARGNTL